MRMSMCNIRLGINEYDFEARRQMPQLGLFSTQDPLKWDNPDVSPYLYCAANPIRFTDPTGLDVYSLDESGYFNFIRSDNNDFDQIIAQNNEMAKVSKDFFKSLFEKEIPNYIVSIYSSSDNIYEFLRDNTSVEWSLVETENIDEGFSGRYIGTSHEESLDYSGDVIMKCLMQPNEVILTHTHSHPGYSYVISESDVKFAEYVQNKFPLAKFYITIPLSDARKSYDKTSDFGVLPELIVTYEK